MAAVKEAVKESLLGTTREPQLSQQTKVTFDQNAIKDDETGEPYMTEEKFVNAIAPLNEDYVRLPTAPAGWPLQLAVKRRLLPIHSTDEARDHSIRSNGTHTQYYSASLTDGERVE